MAEGRQGRIPNVQDFVQSILSAVTNLQHSSQTREENASHSDLVQQFTSLSDELNSRFRIPRTQNSSADASVPQVASNTRVSTQNFNPRQNYSFQRAGRRRPQKPPVNKNATPVAMKPDVVFKDVCLLPTPEWNEVPRGSVKTKLTERRLYVDAFRLDKNWNEARLYSELSCLFENILKPDGSHEIGFEFVKSSGCKIVPMHLPHGQERTGRVIKHVSGQGPIYLRALEDLCDENKDEDGDLSDQFEDNMSNAGNKATTDMSDNGICSHNSSKSGRSEEETSFSAVNECHSSRKTQQSIEQYILSQQDVQAVANLEALFPNIPVLELENIYKDSLDFEHALEVVLRRYDEKVLSETETASRIEADSVIQSINSLNTAGLEVSGASTNNSGSDDEQVWNVPLSTAFFKDDDDAPQCLKRFLSGAVNPFGDELDLVLDRNKDILEQAVRKYKNSAFDVTRPLNVSFKQELGVDAGGLTREYFHLLMKRMRTPKAESITLFEGSGGHLVPIHNYDLLSEGLFVLAGKMILHSILNRCTGITGLSPAVLVYLITGSRDAAVEHIVVEDVPDPVYQELLYKLVNCSDDQLKEFTLPESSLNISDLLVSAGYPHITVSPERRQLAFECCLQYEVITKRVSALDDIRKGLQSVKVWGNTLTDLLEKLPILKEKLFPVNIQESISLPELYPYVEFEIGNDALANKMQDFFEKYLNELNERDSRIKQENLGDLLLFWTGFSSLPTDTSAKVVVRLLKKDENKALPEADTCPRVLFLPTIHEQYPAFRNAMDKAIEYAKYGFGKM